VKEYREKFANPYLAAEEGWIDAIIEPKAMRSQLILAFERIKGRWSSGRRGSTGSFRCSPASLVPTMRAGIDPGLVTKRERPFENWLHWRSEIFFRPCIVSLRCKDKTRAHALRQLSLRPLRCDGMVPGKPLIAPMRSQFPWPLRKSER